MNEMERHKAAARKLALDFDQLADEGHYFEHDVIAAAGSIMLSTAATLVNVYMDRQDEDLSRLREWIQAVSLRLNMIAAMTEQNRESVQKFVSDDGGMPQ
jgi:hypothetical protein